MSDARSDRGRYGIMYKTVKHLNPAADVSAVRNAQQQQDCASQQECLSRQIYFLAEAALVHAPVCQTNVEGATMARRKGPLSQAEPWLH